MIYDLFYVSKNIINDDDWEQFRSRYPLAQKIENVQSFNDIKKKAFTKMFWVVWDDIIVADDFVFDYEVEVWDIKYVHVFKNDKTYDGIAIFPKNFDMGEREFTYRFYPNKKEIDIIASYPKLYDKFIIDTYEDYENALLNSTTEMFWIIWPEITITDESILDLYFSHHNGYDRAENHIFKNLRNGEETYLNGVVLCSKQKPLSAMEIKRRYVVDKKEHDEVVSTTIYDKFIIDTYEDYENAVENSTTEMFWIIWPEITVTDESIFDLYYDPNNGKYDHDRSENHIFKNSCNGEETYLDGLVLCSKQKPLSAMEIKRRYVVDKKEHDEVVSKNMYNKFIIDTYEDYENALKNSTTEMFWVIWPELTVTDDSIFDLYYDPNNGKYDHDRSEHHIFKNLRDNEETYLAGLVLCSKQKPLSAMEIKRRYVVDKKEHDEVVSKNMYNKFIIDTYEDYENAVENSTTEMFWIIWPELTVTDDSIFDLYYDPNNGKYDHDRSEHHIFKNLRNGEETYLAGLVLCSKQKPLSAMEIKRRYIVDKKEHDEVVSKNMYDKFVIGTHEDYENALKNSTTEMFWVIWPELTVTDDSIFDLYYDPNNGKYDHDRSEHHIFKNTRNGEETYLDGLVLCSKQKPLSAMEIKRRYVVDKKEHDEVVSKNMYNKFVISTHEDYENALKNSTTEMFWVIWPEITVTNDSIFDLYYDPNNGKYNYDRAENHVFKHIFRGEETYSGGIVLCSTQKPINAREFTHRFLVDRKEHDIVASKLKPYDIVFISYNEPNADDNYQDLVERFPRAKRVHGVKGIHNAHVEAAALCDTDMFWVVDGDAEIVDDFKFKYEISSYEKDIVHVWRSRNPINDLEYGYGGIKLLPRELTLNMDITSADMTTAISKKFKAVQEVSNITSFNTDEFSTWKSAFRECVKLSSKVIARQKSKETEDRLDIWCTVGADKPYGEYAISGAKAGREYGSSHKDDTEALAKINDFDWLLDQFNKTYKG